MRACGIQPQTITFCALIRSLASRKEYYTKAFELFSQMKSMGVRPNDYVLSALLYATAQQNDFDNSLELWRTVETMKIEKTKILYTAMLFCIAKTQTKEVIKTREYGDLTQGKRIRVS
jgi:pentatricopeptide repeat protein